MFTTKRKWEVYLHFDSHWTSGNSLRKQSSTGSTSQHTQTKYFDSVAHQEICFLSTQQKKIGITLILWRWTAIAVFAVVIFVFDSLREEGSMPLTSQVRPVSRIPMVHGLKIAALGCYAAQNSTTCTTLFMGQCWSVSLLGIHFNLHITKGLGPNLLHSQSWVKQKWKNAKGISRGHERIAWKKKNMTFMITTDQFWIVSQENN